MATDFTKQGNPQDSNQNIEINKSGQIPVNSSNRFTSKWIIYLMLISGIGLVSESIFERFFPSFDKIDMQSQDHFVSKDIYELYKKGQIPKSFFQLKDIKWSYYDPDLELQIPKESIPFKTSINGIYNLEIDAFSSQKSDLKIAILQMNLIEIKSGNKIWELSRNYEIRKTK